MADRPFWKGNLKLSLVNCPVRIYTAVNAAAQLRFNFLHEDTHNRIKMVPVDPELGEVSRDDLVKGYQYEKGKYVVVSEEDFKKAQVEATHTINLESFIPAQEIDCLHKASPYYVVPDKGKEALESYIVIRQAMQEAKMVGIGHVVIGGRERLVGLSATGKGFLLNTLRTADELKDEEDYFREIADKKVDKEMVAIARQIIAGKSGHFKPEKFTDHYEEALMEIIQAKIKGRKPIIAEAPREGNVVNLADALRRSLKAETGDDKPAKTKPAAKNNASRKKKAAAKKTARKAA
jgi:DNA end-binding protein Ku